MTVTTHPNPAVRTPQAPRAAQRIAMAGVALGVAAGLTQLVAGSTIPQWSGNKLDTTGLGITTILLSLVAGVGLWQVRRELPRWERGAVVLLVITCAGVCFTTVGRLWWIPGPLLIAAALLAFAAGPSPELATSGAHAHAPAGAERPTPTRVGGGGWLAYAVAVVLGLAVAVSSLITVLLGQYPPSVAAAAAVTLVCGLALSAGVAPSLRRRVPALLTGGFGAGLMAGGLVLGASAAMIVMS